MLAEQTRIAPSTVWMYEAGKSVEPRPGPLGRLAAFFRVDPLWLLYGERDKDDQ